MSNYYKNNRSEMLEFLPKVDLKKILEIGPGEGYFSRLIKNHAEYWAVEINDKLDVGDRFTRVIRGSYEEISGELPCAYFDIVICNDVIEHMKDHESFLENIQIKMTKEASIVGSIPNIRHYKNLLNLLIKKDWQYTNEGILDRTHLRFFTEKSFIECVTKLGYRISKIKGINGISINDGYLKYLVKLMLVGVFGLDSQYQQFGFCIEKIND
jgi:hypothetical protein